MIPHDSKCLPLVTAALAAMSLAPAPELVAAAPRGDRRLEKNVVIRAPLADVWAAWTTAEGLKPVSAASRVQLWPGGAYEWFVDGPADERGRRGGEGVRVLAFLPNEMLAFDWSFPPAVPSLRLADARTQVVVFFAERDDGVHVRFVQHGWRDGEDWDAGYRYFDEAWDWVLKTMKEHLESR